MSESCRAWWRNCAVEADPEILAIDALEDRIAPIGAELAAVRTLVSSLELCHHKAERWVHNAVEAIASGESGKELGTRPPGQVHHTESVWQSACAALEAWCAGHPSSDLAVLVGTVPASELLTHLGERSPLKEWQVQRVVEKIRNFVGWPRSLDDPTAQYSWILSPIAILAPIGTRSTWSSGSLRSARPSTTRSTADRPDSPWASPSTC